MMRQRMSRIEDQAMPRSSTWKTKSIDRHLGQGLADAIFLGKSFWLKQVVTVRCLANSRELSLDAT